MSMTPIAERVRGFLPVVVDVETAGFDCQRHALLEIAAVVIAGESGNLQPVQTLHYHVEPFVGAILDPQALAFNGIDPEHPLRGAIPEAQALRELFRALRGQVRDQQCRRAVLVGHNANFDLSFLHAAAAREQLKNSPFHPFSTLDTVTLSALALGETVLAKAVRKAGLDWDGKQAHSALYDAERTAALFCWIWNRFDQSEISPFSPLPGSSSLLDRSST
ncbi:ribonuclease T [Acidithiobacillus sp. YTS05]|uniref:ribonuclease T n=1 Tax=Igneacidithiobacillus copahuensis TaxID=2724909 RepID=UPI001D01A57B|nr:ribonuclease T [Igneacidithiobacillus copahuensis]UTV80579.1 ribonuclease T [Acidithiobacillus sp. YTS05]